MDPILAEIIRCKGPADIQDTAFRKWQVYLRDVVHPWLQERESLLAERELETAAGTAQPMRTRTR